MAKRLYVGGLPYNTTEIELREEFEKVGPVEKVNLISDRETGRSKGFAFVEMVNEEDSDKAIAQFNDADFGGRKLVVNEARPQEKRDDYSSNNRSSGGYQGGNNRGNDRGGSRY